ncbi:hypothetical protein ACHAP8_004987 [Fusarium lateritium]
MPPNQQPLVVKTFRVLQKVESNDIKELEKRSGYFGFMVVDVGAFGLIPLIQSNRDGNSNGFVPYPVVKVYHHTISGPEPLARSPLGQGKCRIPLSHIEIGAIHTETPKVVGQRPVAFPSLSLQTSTTSSPLRTFLETFLTTVNTAQSRNFLLGHGAHHHTLQPLDTVQNRPRFIHTLLEGMKLCGTLAVFQDGMPRLKTIWNTCRYVDRSSSHEPFEKQGTYFYLIIYYDETTGDAGLYIGKTVNLKNRLQQHTLALSSTTSSSHY